MSNARVIVGDCRAVLASMDAESVDCCVTSPPYWGLRDYGNAAQIGLEPSIDGWVSEMVTVFEGVRRVLKPTGTLWLNLGDSYNAYNGGRGASKSISGNVEEAMPGLPTGHGLTCKGVKNKDLIGQPWLVAFALRAAGWYLRSEIIWHKPNPMPESVTDRPTKSHEQIFLLTKSPRYFYDGDAIAEQLAEASVARLAQDIDAQEGSERAHAGGKTNGTMKAVVKMPPIGGIKHAANGFHGGAHTTYSGNTPNFGTTRNSRSVWTIPTQGYKGSHFATFPRELAARCIKAGCPGPGKRCDCDEIIETPLGNGGGDDPTIHTGRAGFNRPRGEDEGSRPITRREQRSYAKQIKTSNHRDEMATAAGTAFGHYIRTDASGARPVPPALLRDWLARGWLREPGPCLHPIEPGGLVLDPFGGTGTTVAEAVMLGRRGVCIELNPEYAKLAEKRIDETCGLLAHGRTLSP